MKTSSQLMKRMGRIERKKADYQNKGKGKSEDALGNDGITTECIVFA